MTIARVADASPSGSGRLPCDLVRHTQSRWRRFVAYVDSLPEDAWSRPTDAAGWTVKDHVAHVTAWDDSLVRLLVSGTPRPESLGISAAAWSGGYGPVNEEIRQHTLHDSVESVRSARDRTWREVQALFARFSDDDLRQPATRFGLEGDRDSLFDKLIDDLGVHYEQHLGYIQAIVDSASDGG
jgi:hypothetical protein